MSKISRESLLAGAAVAALLASSSAAFGQAVAPATEAAQAGGAAQAPDAGDIIVTARKRAESAQNVPVTMDALTNVELTRAHIATIDDLKKFSADLNIRTRADNTADVSMRGVGSFGLTPGVGFYVNDVQVFEGQTARFSDIAQVEVLKGPQGTLYGGSSIGGAIKYATTAPADHFEAQATLEAGRYNSFYGSATLSGPITAGFNGRINYFHSSTDGYIYNDVTGSNKNGLTDEDGFRVTLQHVGATTHVTLYFVADLLDTGNSNLYSTPTAPDDAGLTIHHGSPDHFARQLYSASLNIDQDIGEHLRLTSITSGFFADSQTATDVDKAAPPILNSYGFTHREVYSEELRLANVGSGSFQWLVGAFFQINDPDKILNSVSFSGNPNNAAQLADPTRYSTSVSNTRQENRTYAVFGSATYRAGPWSFELGARFGRTTVSMIDPRANLSITNNGSAFLPKGSISYHFSHDVMGYATISRGETPGGTYEAFVAGVPELLSYRPEKTWNYEVGVKSTILGNVRLNASAFYISYTDRLFQTTEIQSTQIVTVNRNIGPSTNYGVEVDLRAPLTHSLVFSATGGLLHAEWGNAQFRDPNNGNVVVDLHGLQVPWAPYYQARAGLDWNHDVGGGFRLGARADISFTGRQFYYPVDRYSGAPYHLINLGLSVEKGSFRLYGNVTNLANHIYNASFISGPEIGSPRNSAQIAPPRMWTLGLSYKY